MKGANISALHCMWIAIYDTFFSYGTRNLWTYLSDGDGRASYTRNSDCMEQKQTTPQAPVNKAHAALGQRSLSRIWGVLELERTNKRWSHQPSTFGSHTVAAYIRASEKRTPKNLARGV
jgi:hypothetical protein